MKTKMELNGIVLSKGIVIGDICFLKNIILCNYKVPCFAIDENKVIDEVNRYRIAINKSKKDINQLKSRYITNKSIIEILNSQLEILNDPIITKHIEKKILELKKNSEFIFDLVLSKYKQQFKSINDLGFQEKLNDIISLSSRILSNLCKKKIMRTHYLKNKILVCDSITPYDFFDMRGIIGIVSKKGGYTSHAAIISRSKNIPYIANIDVDKIDKISTSKVIIDGINGKIIINPMQNIINHYRHKKQKMLSYHTALQEKYKNEPYFSNKSGLNIYSNIEDSNDVNLVADYHSTGIGLFRSEYLCFMEKKIPTQEEQYQIYKKILEQIKDRPFVIRLFDIGNDKLEKEDNKFGCNGIRYLFKKESVLKNQLKAILRVNSINNNIKILLPFITDVLEVKLLKKYISICKNELLEEKKEFSADIQIGCMMELPCAILNIKAFVDYVDFFSIGTNDLTQYLLAIDRSNPCINYLCDAIHPIIFKLIFNMLEISNQYNKQVVVCGEMTYDIFILKILIGLGIKNFSINVRYIPSIKEIIKNLDFKKAEELAKEVIKLQSIDELKKLKKDKHKLTDFIYEE